MRTTILEALHELETSKHISNYNNKNLKIKKESSLNKGLDTKSLREAKDEYNGYYGNDYVDQLLMDEFEFAVKDVGTDLKELVQYFIDAVKESGDSLTREQVNYLTKQLKSRLNDTKSLREAKDHVPFLRDLWDQVYCSLTDGGDNRIYAALGDLNGKNHYNPDEVSAPRGSQTDITATIRVRSDNLDWARHIADVYDLQTEEGRGYIDLFVPFPEDVDYNFIKKGSVDKVKRSVDSFNNRNKVKESLKRRASRARRLRENVESSMPVSVLSEDQVLDFIKNIPTITGTKGPTFFKLGYISELAPSSKYRGGRGSVDKATGEAAPKVRVFKCTEYSKLYTGSDWKNTNATKAADKILGKERHTGEKTGFKISDEDSLTNKIGLYKDGSKALQAYIASDSRQKVKYFISLNDEDLHEASREEVAQYFSPSVANTILNGRTAKAAGTDTEGNDVFDKPINRFKLDKIYMIGSLGRSIM